MFFTLGDGPSRLPTWMFNDRIEGSPWKRCPVEVLHPLQVPIDLRRHAVVLGQCGDVSELVPAAVKAGIYLTLDQLMALHGHYGYDLPEPGCGHGVNGNLVKKDYAEGLVRHLFGAEGTPQMVEAIMGRKDSCLGVASRHTNDLLKAFKSLDPEDQPDFEKLAEVARDEEKRAAARLQRADVAVPHGATKHETPKVLSTLLPEGDGFVCQVNRHPMLRRYQLWIVDKTTRRYALYTVSLTVTVSTKSVCFGPRALA